MPCRMIRSKISLHHSFDLLVVEADPAFKSNRLDDVLFPMLFRVQFVYIEHVEPRAFEEMTELVILVVELRYELGVEFLGS